MTVIERCVEAMTSVLHDVCTVEEIEDVLAPIHPDDWKRAAQAVLDAANHQGAVSRAEKAERALGDLLGRLNRIPAEHRAHVLGDGPPPNPGQSTLDQVRAAYPPMDELIARAEAGAQRVETGELAEPAPRPAIWTIYVCTGCGGATGRHKACDGAKRAAVEVVPVERLDTAVAAIAAHRTAIESIGAVEVADAESRRRAEAKHAADVALWQVGGGRS